ncbi:glycoside hydrolase family 2 protein [Rhodopirellula sp. MGV]|uniref:glycoside hydrolase family 2 protein n=1 Tax=Rhodopirellula sp. MGV TaxID=2023130 RepID=UPI000B96FB41|nr:sugar-binding domain-containing protein [Rhodopirellula sp. MGV]OYP32168.1 glycoside hydrolase family 2 [Rhodopirellula sp. MGV]PNY35176.1 glycoside hydrolase family 2 [Rhodopirellula baltica]
MKLDFKHTSSLLSAALLSLGLSSATPPTSLYAQEISDTWKFSLERPAGDWTDTDFAAEGWKDAQAGLGSRGTPGARLGMEWTTNDVWLRKTFTLESVPARPAILIHHDEEAEIYINGELAVKVDGYTTKYELVTIPESKRSLLKTGENLLAVHCHQERGGQYIDAHVVDAENVPELPPPPRVTKPYESDLITKWGEALTADDAWTEYPRPQMERASWTCLNGNWDYAITEADQNDVPSDWQGEILVPFCLESKLGGVHRLLHESEALWYHRTFNVESVSDQRTLLNFEAVDYRCEVFVNGKSVGTHIGGNTPFALDASDAIKVGENELVVRVEDDTEAWQLRGKQVLNANGIWYTQVSGIWQTVWLEQVAQNYIEELEISTDADKGTITVEPELVGSGAIKVVVKDGDKVVNEASGNGSLTLQIANAKLWSPNSPHLYGLEVHLLDASGNVVDQVNSYAGIRSVGKTKDEDGNWRFTLNGDVIFHWGPLDQGWWPDGLLTPPSDEAMLFDIEWLKNAGFNMIRKHIKVEPRRYYYHCDRLGMMVWQDQVSGGQNWPAWTRLQPNPVDGEWPDEHHQQYMDELEWMIDSLENHPSIVCWVPFNEAWGQHRTVEVGKWTAKRDPSRLVNIASGGNFWPAGDIVDAHAYPHPNFPYNQGQNGRFDDFIKVMGEFGGHGYAVRDHLWEENRGNWGYGGLPESKEEYEERYATSLEKLNELRKGGIAAGVYTQTTDVEGEINGLMTYDRKVIKIPAESLNKMHQVLFNN